MHVLGCVVQVQGGILNFEVLRPDGSVFSYKTFEREAAEAGFHVRTGAECNPGACYNYLGVQVRMCTSQALVLGRCFVSPVTSLTAASRFMSCFLITAQCVSCRAEL